jgi:hypothetical protein
VVGVFVDYDLVSAPVPAIDVGVFIGEDAEVEAVEPEAITAAAFDAPRVAFAEAAGKVAVFPRTVEVKTGIFAAGVVADPFIVGVNVRGLGVTLAVGISLL